MKPVCYICKSSSYFLMNKDDFDLYECSECKLVFVYPQPEYNTLSNSLYSYESGYQSNRANEDLSKNKELERMNFVLDFFQSIKKDGKMLDVGCGNGQTLFWAKKRGLMPFGVEVNKRTADSAISNGLNVFNGFLKDVPYQDNTFDFIFLGEIIEHLDEPRKFLEKCRNLLKENGLVAITTPNLDCFWSKSTLYLYYMFNIPWSSVTPPYHLFQFSVKNLDRLLNQQDFVLASSHFVPMTKLRYELGMLHLVKRFKKNKSIKNLLFILVSFGLYTVLYILNLILRLFLEKDFNMVRIYKKNKI